MLQEKHIYYSVVAVQGHCHFINLSLEQTLHTFMPVSVISLCIPLKDKLDFAQTVWLCLKKNQRKIISGSSPVLEYWVRRVPTVSRQLLWSCTIQIQNVTAKPCNITHMKQEPWKAGNSGKPSAIKSQLNMHFELLLKFKCTLLSSRIQLYMNNHIRRQNYKWKLEKKPHQTDKGKDWLVKNISVHL